MPVANTGGAERARAERSRTAPSTTRAARPRVAAYCPIRPPSTARSTCPPAATTSTSPGRARSRALCTTRLSPGRVRTVRAGPATTCPGIKPLTGSRPGAPAHRPDTSDTSELASVSRRRTTSGSGRGFAGCTRQSLTITFLPSGNRSDERGNAEFGRQLVEVGRHRRGQSYALALRPVGGRLLDLARQEHLIDPRGDGQCVHARGETTDVVCEGGAADPAVGVQDDEQVGDPLRAIPGLVHVADVEATDAGEEAAAQKI